MAIPVVCPNCSAAFKIPDRQAGRRGKCPKCKGEFFAPAPMESAGIQAQEAFDDFFVDALSLMQSIPLPRSHPSVSTNPKQTRADLIDARQDMQVAAEENIHTLKRWNVVQPRLIKAEVAVVMLRAGCKIKAEEYELHSASLSEAQAAVAEGKEGIRKIQATLEPFQNAAARRLVHSLELLPCEPIASRVAGGPDRLVGTLNLFPTAAFLAVKVAPEMSNLMDSMQIAGRLAVAIGQNKNDKNERFMVGCYEAMMALMKRFEGFRTVLQGAPPSIIFNEEGEVSLARYAIPSMPHPDDPVGLIQAADHATSELVTLYRHSLGRLAVVAEEVEKVLGLPPLERVSLG